MAEYIKKAELIKACNYTVCYEDDEETFGISEAMIDLMPTIDIVHCYKCKHYEKYTEHTGLCNHFVVNGERLAMEYDWFCGDGEREERR